MNQNNFTLLHATWLTTLFSSFALPQGELKGQLYDFSEIIYRHLRWVENALLKQDVIISYERPNLNFKYNNIGNMISTCKIMLEGLLEQYEGDDELSKRISADLQYIIFVLSTNLTDETPLKAFNRELKLSDETELTPETIMTLVTFLFDESYKEYELIVIYSYAQTRIDNQRIHEIFQILIDESKFHLKSFAQIMTDLGILTIPRFITSEIYAFDSLEKFLLDGIDEEEAAKEECRAIAQSINHKPLRNFFNFINTQESYHIALMEEALEIFRNLK
ncbi:MAG: iron-binding protein [Campylobacterota bacterium]|nr:iron-binding protein [Campylobacterota bacterium]